MRSLLQFILRYNSVFVFAFLEIICFALIIYNHPFQRSSFISSTNAITGNTLNWYNGLVDYFNLEPINDSLMAENASLMSNQAYAFRSTSTVVDTVVKDTLELAYTFIAADVIDNDFDRKDNYITINKGAKNGVEKYMGVMLPNGVVGKVINASDNFSLVMSVLHSANKVSVRHKKTNNIATLSWMGGNPELAEVEGLPVHLDLQKGDTLVTSGFSMLYPKGILVGVIDTLSRPSGSNFYKVSLKLSTDFRSLEYVYVVNYLNREERELLKAIND